MKRLSLAAVLALAAVPASLGAQTAADSAAIRAAALDYAQGWYEGDAARMQRAVHPDLVKRIPRTDPATGRTGLVEMTAAQLVGATGRGGGRDTPAEGREADVRILDAFPNTASVRTTMAGWIDYMHLARVDGRWVIVNVLWETRPRASSM